MKTHIITVHHKYTDSINVFKKYFHPIHVGSELSSAKLEIEKDNLGDNISKKNPNYCELTAQYYVWKKNLDVDYVGLMHYRRILNSKTYIYQILRDYSLYIAKVIKGIVRHTDLNLHYLPMEKINSFALLEKTSNKLIDYIERNEEIDVFLPKFIKFKYLNVENQYAIRHCKHQFDVFNCVAIEKYPELKSSIDIIVKRKKLHAFNIFIMKKSLFDEYSEMLFKVMQAFEARISLYGMNQHQSRIFGFLSERFLNYYILYKSNANGIRVKHLNVTFVEEKLI